MFVFNTPTNFRGVSASDPSSGQEGEFYYNTGDDAFRYYNGSSWVSIGGTGAVSPLVLTSNGVSEVPLTLKGTVSQSADLFKGVNSGDTRMWSYTKDGHLHFATDKKVLWNSADPSTTTSSSPDSTGIYVRDTNNNMDLLAFGGVLGAKLRIAGGGNYFEFYSTHSGTVDFKVDGSTAAGQTRMLVYDVDNATLERVTVGAADSGGSGFKVLRIPN